MISTLLTQPPPLITLIPEHLRHQHLDLQHLTDDDITHCTQHNHHLTPLTLHFHAANADDDNQLLEEYIHSLKLPLSLSTQLLQQITNASLARQLSFLAPCGPYLDDHQLCSTLLAVPLQLITVQPAIRHLLEQTHHDSLDVTQVYTTGFSELLFQVRATPLTFFNFIMQLIFANELFRTLP